MYCTKYYIGLVLCKDVCNCKLLHCYTAVSLFINCANDLLLFEVKKYREQLCVPAPKEPIIVRNCTLPEKEFNTIHQDEDFEIPNAVCSYFIWIK